MTENWDILTQFAIISSLRPCTQFFLNKLPPHSYTILAPLAAQILANVTPSGQVNPSLLQHFTPLGSPTLTSFYPLWTNYPLILTPFYHYWKPNAAQKDVRVLSFIFLKILPMQPPSYVILVGKIQPGVF